MKKISVEYVVVPDEGKIMHFDDLGKAKLYAREIGVSAVRRFKIGKLGVKYEIAPIPVEVLEKN